MPRLPLIFLVALLAAAGCSRQPSDSVAARGGAGGPPVPVIAGKAERRDTPIYLDGIGTVQAFNAVTVRTQVEGVLMKVAFTEGQEVKAGDLLAIVDPRTYQAQFDQAQAKKAQDEAQLASATLTFQRNSSLLKQGLADQQTVDLEKATVDQLRALVQADQAAVEAQSIQLAYTSITAPTAGRTGIRLVDQGNVVHPTDTNGIVVINQLKPISVIFTLPQQDWPRLRKLSASGAPLSVLAVGDGGAVLDTGTLGVVDNQIDTTTGTIRLKAVFPNEALALWPGQFVSVRLLVETRPGGIVVPASVVQRGPQGSYAFVIRADSTVEPRPIQVSQVDAGYALIDKGLQAGESVVVDGQYKLQTGSRVTTAPAASSRPARQPASK